MFKKIFVAFFVLSLWIPSAHGRDTLLMFSDVSGKPFTWQEGDQIVGPIVDLIAQVFNDLGIPIKTVFLPWPRAIFHMQNGDLDLILTMFHSPEREKFMVYTVPYGYVYNSIFVKKGREFPYRNWVDLIGRQGLVVRGDSYGGEFDAFAKDQLDLYSVGTLKQMIGMLMYRRKDYMICPKNTLIEIAELGYHDMIVPLPMPVNKQEVYITFSKKSPFLKYLPNVNQQILKMQKSGAIERMIENVILDSVKK
ncbi:MAG: transporter substrate-binding domain-containing protein [Proteobacteria bacterium]|nr:transporter substrate-binding domain-containing protein [Pseudomonadota bacterium]